MRFGRMSGRLTVFVDGVAVDAELASHGRFGPDADAVFERWDAFRDWAAALDPGAPGADAGGGGIAIIDAQLEAPVLRPAQVFAIGLNYREHAAEAGVEAPSSPPVFTKFPTCLTGPRNAVALPTTGVDWEVELVVVIGRRAEHVSEERGWSHVAGVAVGQDLSERAVQLAGPVPQFSLGKSFAGFGPIGPWIVTPDELAHPDDLGISCSVDDEILQKARTSDMIFSVPELISRISAVCPLLPGDVLFTGTPPGVGMGRKPPRYLEAGTTLVSTIEGIGELRNPLTAGPGYGRQPSRST